MRKALFLLVLVLLAGFALAVPSPPAELKAEFDPNGILISWAHEAASEVSFNIYRGPGPDSSKLLANTVERNYLDRTVKPGEEYWYYITAVDGSGESIAVKFNVTNIGAKEKPFAIVLVEPEETSFAFGEKVDFVVRVESDSMDVLEGLSASISSQELGFDRQMSFDSLEKIFVSTVEMPEQAEGAFSAKVKIQVNALFEGEEFSESQTHSITVVPERAIDVAQLALNFFALFAPIFVLFAVIGAGVVVWGVWSARLKAEKDRLRVELLEVQKELLVWRTEVFKRRITPEQFKEKAGALQGKRNAIEEKLGIKHVKGEARHNAFEGFSPMEAQEVMMLVKSIGRPKKGETVDSLRARLVGLGKSEKIAKKATEIVFQHFQ